MAHHFNDDYEDLDYALPEADELAPGRGRGITRDVVTETVVEPVPEQPAWHRYVIAGICLVLALFSFFVLGDWLSSPDAHANTIASLDQKKSNVTTLAAGSTATSVAITAIPDDVGTPIAEQLADVGHDFFIVLAAIYLEKYLLTILCWAAFKLLIPIGLAMIAITVLVGREHGPNPTIINVAVRIIIFSVFASLVVPASVFLSDMIENTYQESIQETMRIAERGLSVASDAETSATASTVEGDQATSSLQGSEGEEGSASASTSEGVEANASAEKGFDFFAWVGDFFAGAGEVLSDIPSAAQSLLEQARNVLSGMIEAFAVMIVTSCLIPILVLFFFMWMSRLIMGININWPMSPIRFRTFERYRSQGSRGGTLTRRK